MFHELRRCFLKKTQEMAFKGEFEEASKTSNNKLYFVHDYCIVYWYIFVVLIKLVEKKHFRMAMSSDSEKLDISPPRRVPAVSIVFFLRTGRLCFAIVLLIGVK
ncbi:hypothetical protein JHK85_001472 [Glycine max]|nr:hypothetical protein JHK85_001472 [Glycine max]